MGQKPKSLGSEKVQPQTENIFRFQFLVLATQMVPSVSAKNDHDKSHAHGELF